MTPEYPAPPVTQSIELIPPASYSIPFPAPETQSWPELANTGLPVWQLVMLAALLLAIGVGAMAWDSRRRSLRGEL